MGLITLIIMVSLAAMALTGALFVFDKHLDRSS